MSILNFKKNSQELSDFCAAILVFFIPISTALPNLFLIPLAIIIFFTKKKHTIVKELYLLMFVISLAFILIQSVLKNNFLYDLNINSRFILLLLIMTLFTQVKNKYKIEVFFVLGTYIAVILSMVAIIQRYVIDANFLLDTGSLVNELLWLERPYFGFILTLCVFICFKNADTLNKQRGWFVLTGVIFVCFSIYISARLSIILNSLLIFYFLFRTRYIKKKTKQILGFILFAILFTLIILNDNITSRMRITDNIELTLHLIKEYEPRFVIWPCTLQLVQQDLIGLTGFDGRKKMENDLVVCYSERTHYNKDKQDYYSNEKFNTHNQFFDFLLIGGLLPFALLVSHFILGWISKNNTLDLKIVLFLFFLFFFVENVLHRQIGVFLFGVFIALYANNIIDNKTSNTMNK